MQTMFRYSYASWLPRAVLSAALCFNQPVVRGASGLTPSVQVVRAHKGEVSRSVTLPATVRPWQESVLYAKVTGYLKSISVDTGDWLKPGELVGEIEAPEMQADLARYKAELLRASAEWNKARAEASRARAEVKVASIDLERARKGREKAADLVMPQTVDDAQARREKAEAELDLALAKQEAAKADQAVIQAQLERTEVLLRYARITAPFSGAVTKRWVDPGALVPAASASSSPRSSAIITLTDFSKVRVQMAVPETEIALVKNGLPARVTADAALGRGFDGRVTRFARALDEATKTMMAEIELPNPTGELRPGMFVSVRLALEQKADVLTVPAEALVVEKKRTFVFAVVQGKARKIEVKTGFNDGITVEILAGLHVDDSVITAGKQAVSDGQAVVATEAR